MKKLVISILLVNLLAACASKKAPEAAPEAAPTPVVQSAPAAAPAAAPAPVVVDALDDPTSILAKRSVYYGLDVDTVADADRGMLLAHAKYLNQHANRSVELVGSADERGSTEYNLALGQRRADGVKKLLELGGASASQLRSVSVGEEKPKAAGHDEAAWSQNRRTDLNYAK